MKWVEIWMNNLDNKIALGVDPERTFSNCNMDVNSDFFIEGDGAYNEVPLLPELIDNGIRLLVYAGNADTMCPPSVRLIYFTPSVYFAHSASGQRALDGKAQEPILGRILQGSH
jgi:hypothetical protein